MHPAIYCILLNKPSNYIMYTTKEHYQKIGFINDSRENQTVKYLCRPKYRTQYSETFRVLVFIGNG